jgi:GT2 family glycosyltransferase
MVRAEIRDQIGLLDESYFMYGEDLDWAFRIKQGGWRVMYTPITTVVHIKRASSRRSRTPTIRAFYDAMRIFYGRYYEKRYPRPVAWLTYAAINLREALELTSARISDRGARA